MKKFVYFFVMLFAFFTIGDVDANSVDSISMDIYIDSNGTAHVKETWDAYLNQGTEVYKPYYNLGNSEIKNFQVYDNGSVYTNIGTWNTSGSLSSKAYKNGLNYISNGVELCFGISKYGRHTYRMEYDITNFVAGLEDADMVYWTLVPYNFSIEPKKVYIKMYADKDFSDNLDVWGYGNKGGYAYVYDGYIEMSTDGALDSDEYMTILVKFPKGTFNTSNNKLNKNFDYYLDMAEEGADHYKESIWTKILRFLAAFFEFFVSVLFILLTAHAAKKGAQAGTYNLDFGKNGKKIPKDTPMFRDLPCNKNVFRAYWVAANYNLMKKQTDFLGAVLLKWLKQGAIAVKKVETGMFKKEKNSIVFNIDYRLDDELENELYQMMVEASKDNILEDNEFEKWCKNNYNKILKWFKKVVDAETLKLVSEGKITVNTKVNLGIFKSDTYVVNPEMLDEAKKMKGLKEFLLEFSLIDKKEAIEVHLWEEYLMYAQIFGIADKVAAQFKKLYPDVITDYSYDDVVFINHISYSGMTSAHTAKSRAESYSSGGGGFSSGGGGGGSFGGGGGGGGFR